MKLLIDHNIKIYNELFDLIKEDEKVKLEKNINKNYFTLIINDNYYVIASFFYNNNIKIDIIGKDNNNIFRVLEVFESSDEIFNYFYKIKCEYYYELNKELDQELEDEELDEGLDEESKEKNKNEIKNKNDNFNKINKKKKYWNKRK
jgi:hypothetical protein